MRGSFFISIAALNDEFRRHDPFIQALALHYHMGGMHPFQDGNGRTARAVEALLLQRPRLKDDPFISMSNIITMKRNDISACFPRSAKKILI